MTCLGQQNRAQCKAVGLKMSNTHNKNRFSEHKECGVLWHHSVSGSTPELPIHSWEFQYESIRCQRAETWLAKFVLTEWTAFLLR